MVVFLEKHSAGKRLLLISVFLQCGHEAYLVTLFLNDAVPTHTLCSETPNASPLQQTTVIHGHN